MMTAPALPDFDPLDVATAIANRRTPLGELAGASIEEGFWSGPGALIARARQGRSGPPGSVDATDEFGQPINTPTSNYTEDAYRQGPWFREGLAWDQHLTEDRARVRAEYFDENQYRRWLISQRESGAVSTAVLFGGSIIGSLPDPLNFIPFAGPAFRAAAVARVGTILGRAATTATDALIGQVIEAPFVYSSRAEFGDDITFADILTDLATGALAGAVLGGAAGIYRTFRPLAAEPVRVQTEARAVLSDAAQSIAMDRPINVDPAPAVALRQSIMGEIGAARGAADAPARDQSLLEMLQRVGLRDEGGDLKAIGADAWHVGRPGMRRLVRDEGISLDRAREIATEAGYIGRGGEIDGNQSTTVADLLSAIDAEVRGRRVYPAGSETELRAADEAARTADRGAMEMAAAERGIDPAGMSDNRLRAALDEHDRRTATEHDRGERAAMLDEMAGRLAARADDGFDVPFDIVAPDRLSPDAAARIKQAESAVAGPRPRTVEERAADLGLERESGDLDAAVKELETAGRLAPDDAAAIKAAREAAQDAEKTARAVEAAAMCRIRS